MDARIEHVEVRHVNAPSKKVLADAMHGDHTHFELVTATVRKGDGVEGTGGQGGHAIAAMIGHDLAPMLKSKDARAIDALYDAMLRHVHGVGRDGVASFAISASMSRTTTSKRSVCCRPAPSTAIA